MITGPIRPLGGDVIGRAQAAAHHLALTEPDWQHVRDLLSTYSHRRSLVLAALRLLAALGELDKADRQPTDIWPYIDRWGRCEMQLIKRLRWQVILGLSSNLGASRSIRIQQYRKTRSALDEHGTLILTDQRHEGTRTCALIALSIVHNQVDGVPLTAICSTGESW